MKLYTFYSDSHEGLFQNFLKKSCLHFKEFDLITKKGEQISIDGSFYSKGFHETVMQKIDFLLKTVDWESGEICVFSDVDVIITDFCKDFFKNEISDYDIVFQTDQTSMNTGFFVFRANKKVENLLKKSKTFNHFGDQLCINAALKESTVKYKSFDKEIFNISFYLNGKIWDNESTIHFPRKMKVYHANFIVGVDNKKKALKQAEKRFLKYK